MAKYNIYAGFSNTDIEDNYQFSNEYESHLQAESAAANFAFKLYEDAARRGEEISFEDYRAAYCENRGIEIASYEDLLEIQWTYIDHVAEKVTFEAYLEDEDPYRFTEEE